jgi:lipopolysaccharide transport system permease protein
MMPAVSARDSTDNITRYRAGQIEPISVHLNPVRAFTRIFARRDLLWQFTLRAVRGRYRGSYLGTAWALLTPILQLAVFTFVFTQIIQVGARAAERGPFDYALSLFAGLIVFNVFSEMATQASQLIVNSPNLVKRVAFPLELLPVSQLGAALFHSVLSIAVLLPAQLLLWGTLPWTVVFLPLVYLPLAMLSVGIGWLLSSLGVFLRDMGNIVAVAVNLLFFLTPVLYGMEDIPPLIQPWMWLNPLAPIVDDFRRVVQHGELPLWWRWLVVMGISTIVMIAGYAWFMKIRRGFADAI